MPNTPHIAVIGGGMAGLAAAAKLTQQGQAVVLFEAGATLGGRARKVHYNGMDLDNGQHILLGAYHETRHLLSIAQAPIDSLFIRLPLKLQVRDLTTGADFILQSKSALPSPLHILGGVLAARGLNIQDKWSAIQLMAWLRLHHFQLKQDQPLAQLLTHKQQSTSLIKLLWEPLCLAALNTPLAQASAQVFANVLRDSFAQHKQDADTLFAKHDLSQTLSEPIQHYLAMHGSQVKRGTTIEQITPMAPGYQLHTKGQSYDVKKVILACGPHQLKRFASTLPNLSHLTRHFAYQAITTVYLQYNDNVQLPSPMIGAVNSLTQWVFDRGLLCGQQGLLAVVISAHHPFKRTQAALASHIAAELQTLFPTLPEKPRWHKVITEKRATFSCDHGLMRPENLTTYPNLYLAGDYTAGDYPATIEGAVRSGLRAADAALTGS